MARTKQRRRIIHEPSTLEIFNCLNGMPGYSKLLLEYGPKKPFTDFLKWLLQENFYNNSSEAKISLKKLSADFKIDPPKTTKWIHEIYHDIFELNYSMPQLFQTQGIKVALLMQSYDNSCSFYTTLQTLPREFETLQFPFAHAKIGQSYFWVKKVEHEILEDETAITLWLEGGFLNKYREFALDKALFQQKIGFMEVYEKHSFELDEEIKKIYRS